MEYNVVLSDQAKEDVAKIYGYILNVLKSEINAESVLNRLYSAMNELSYMAESYHLYPNEPWILPLQSFITKLHCIGMGFPF